MEEGEDAEDLRTSPRSGDDDRADASVETEAVERDTEWIRGDGYLNATAIASVAVSLTTEASCQWNDYSRPNKAFLDKLKEGLEIVGGPIDKTVDRVGTTTWLHWSVGGLYVAWLEKKRGCKGLEEKVKQAFAPYKLSLSKHEQPPTSSSGHHQDPEGEEEEEADRVEGEEEEEAEEEKKVVVDEGDMSTLRQAVELSYSLNKQNIELWGHIDELVSELKGSKDQQIIMVGEAPSGKRQRLETHEPGKTWLDVMVDRRGQSVMAPLLDQSTQKAFKPFLVLDMDLTLLHSFRNEKQALTGDFFPVTLTCPNTSHTANRYWELLPGIEDFLHKLAQSFELCLLSASPLYVINQFVGVLDQRMHSKELLEQGKSIMTRVATCRFGDDKKDVTPKRFDMFDIPRELCIGLDDCPQAWHMEDVGQVFPFMAFGEKHKDGEQEEGKAAGEDKPGAKKKAVMNPVRWLPEVITALLAVRETFITQVNEKGSQSDKCEEAGVYMPTMADCLKRAEDKAFMRLALPTIGKPSKSEIKTET